MNSQKKQYTFGLIEDNDLQRRFIVGNLQTLFPTSKVLVATNIHKGLDLINQHKLDLLMLDVHLGKDHCQDLLVKFPAESRAFPVIIITADKTEETLALMFQMGVNDYITKPIDHYYFEAKLTSLLTGKYISPLAFFGKNTGIGKAELSFNLEVLEANEQFMKFKTSIMMGVGAQVQLDLKGMTIPVKVINNELAPKQDYYICHSAVLLDLMDAKQRAFLRSTLLKLT